MSYKLLYANCIFGATSTLYYVNKAGSTLKDNYSSKEYKEEHI